MCTSVPESRPAITLTREQAQAIVDNFFSTDADPVQLRTAIARLSFDLDQMDYE